MTSCHLIAHLDLALLGDKHLGILDHAVGELVTDGGVKLLTVVAALDHLGLVEVIDDQVSDQLIVMLVRGPALGHHLLVDDLLEHGTGDLDSLGDHSGADVVLDPLADLTIGQSAELGEEKLLQLVLLLLLLLVELLLEVTDRLAAVAGLDGS